MKSFIGWIGGKRLLCKEIVNLFRCVKYHCDELQKELRFVLNSREMFEHFKGMNTDGMTDIQRAARFFMMVKTSYGAKAENGTFGCVKKDISVMITYLKVIEHRLSNVVIENRDFEVLFEAYGERKSLFYLDPPYYGTEKYYAAFFPAADHERLFKCLQGLKSDFILSYNDCEYIRELYRDYSITEAKRTIDKIFPKADKFGRMTMIKIHILEIPDRMGMSQIELSSRTGIRPAIINQLYHEESVTLNLKYLSKLCEALNCEVGDILEYIPDPKQPKKLIKGINIKG